MPPSSRLAFLLLAACQLGPPNQGIQIGALREPDPSPAPPTDFQSLDMTQAVEDALGIGGLATLSAAWTGHIASLEVSRADCPTVWVGGLPEDASNMDFDEDNPGMSWLDDCATDPGQTTFAGLAHWSSSIVEDTSGLRSLAGDALVTDNNGAVLFAFDGEASDTVDLPSGTYSSLLNGELSGELAGVGSGFRTGGEFEATWSTDGTIRMFGTVTTFDGFGPPDDRKLETSPELQNLSAWSEEMPRFTSIRFDLAFTPECAEEPIGFVGIRGNEGFWFDAYFLPDPALVEGTAQYKAFPWEEIDNIACDGIGTLFARNVNLKAYDDEDPNWSRELTPDFGAVIASLSLPSLDTYIYTLRDIQE